MASTLQIGFLCLYIGIDNRPKVYMYPSLLRLMILPPQMEKPVYGPGGLQCYMKEEKVCAMNIFDRDDPGFKRLYYTCDNYFRELHADGVGSQSRPTEVLTPADEEKLWPTGVLSVETPKGLLNAVFFFSQWKELHVTRRS